jgi:ribosomal protein S18 acetylase RimI-like enzyme
MIRYGNDTDREILARLWKLCFPDTNRFIRFYFDKVYANGETLVYVENDQPVASLQMIPFRIKTGDSFSQGGYISGAMTRPDYRKRGYMEQLLTASFDSMREKGYVYTFLIPQEEYLIDYYGKFGYEKAFPEYFISCHCPEESKLSANVNIYTGFSMVDFPALYGVYSRFLMEKTNVVLKNELQFSNTLWDFFDGKGVLFANNDGFAFSSKAGKSIKLLDFFYRNEETKTEFLQTVSAYYSGKGTIIYNDSSVLIPKYKGMIKSLDKSVTAATDIYMGRMLE